jgi:hypothetical protein
MDVYKEERHVTTLTIFVYLLLVRTGYTFNESCVPHASLVAAVVRVSSSVLELAVFVSNIVSLSLLTKICCYIIQFSVFLSLFVTIRAVVYIRSHSNSKRFCCASA